MSTAKLSFRKARQIREAYPLLVAVEGSPLGAKQVLAFRFGVHIRTIERILTNKMWVMFPAPELANGGVGDDDGAVSGVREDSPPGP